jgi:DNA-binding transcriptional ArsR family regulator
MLDQQVDLDRAFHALADGSRRSMVARLAIGPASVSELAGPLRMTLAAVVQHVQVLEASGVIRTEKVGRVRLCRIEPGAMSAVEAWMVERRRAWGARLDRLGEVLAEDNAKQPNEENI